MSTSSVEKGNNLEHAFIEYLRDQLTKNELVYGIYPPALCNIRHKPKYYCSERDGRVEFDIAIEVSRSGGEEPHLYVIFECKNYTGSVPETKITDFSDKLSRILKHNAKGVVVTTNGLQSGAKNLAMKRGLGIAKYDSSGVDIVAERRGGLRIGKKQIGFELEADKRAARPLKFAGFYKDKTYATIEDLLEELDPCTPADRIAPHVLNFLPIDEIAKSANQLHEQIGYTDGIVDLRAACEAIDVRIETISDEHWRGDDRDVLGLANFSQKTISLGRHSNEFQERFTIAHELGHFVLGHSRYLHSDLLSSVDKLEIEDQPEKPNIVRLEAQANAFASEFLLPTIQLNAKVSELRSELGIQNKGHGYIFVDDQPCNYSQYNLLAGELKTFFGVSKLAIEVKLKRQGLLNDQRRTNWQRATLSSLD